MKKLLKRLVPRGLFQAIEPYGHLAEAIVYTVMNGFPARGIKVIGVTGTNGKTTTSFMIQKMLSSAGYKTGLMTTVAYGVDDDIQPQTHHMTTVPVPVLMRRLKKMRKQGIEWLVLETTSHALAQHRVWGIPYSIAVFTNLSHEHLDYHRTFERYRDAKIRLFKLAARNRHGLRTGIINADDPSWHYFADAVPNVVTYGLGQGDIRAEHIRASTMGSEFTAEYKDLTMKLSIAIPGAFNVSNALAAAATGAIVGLSDKQIEQGIGALHGVAGRMETIDEGQNFGVVVDYAVTPDALQNALQTLRATTKGKVIVVFGATGDRDKSKRPIMGEVAAKCADTIYLTDDETYTEVPNIIRQAVYEGIERAGGAGKTTIIGDRRKAIVIALHGAQKDDVVLVAGMGHQATRNMGGIEKPWNERQIVRDLLKQRS
jgi:UDP-N-acetylmuramoyl-L-alanyl-D-glutamate--2,6-diaminopimelate ligase